MDKLILILISFSVANCAINELDLKNINGSPATSITDTNETLLIVDYLPLAISYEHYALFRVVKHEDSEFESIYMEDIGGLGSKLIVWNVTKAYALEYDWLRRRLYFLQSERVEEADINGNNRKMLYTGNFDKTYMMTSDPNYQLLFWADTDMRIKGKIERADMSGNESSRVIILNSRISFPVGLTVDSARQFLYLVDAERRNAQRVDYNGVLRSIIKRREDFVPRGVVFYDNLLYWADSEYIYELYVAYRNYTVLGSHYIEGVQFDGHSIYLTIFEKTFLQGYNISEEQRRCHYVDCSTDGSTEGVTGGGTDGDNGATVSQPVWIAITLVCAYVAFASFPIWHEGCSLTSAMRCNGDSFVRRKRVSYISDTVSK